MLVGLGNPGRKYKKTRHNIGYIIADEVASLGGFDIKKKRFKARFAKELIFGKEICFVKPETYMNLSGEAVRSFMNYYKISPHHILVIHDDIDMDFGRLKFAYKSGHGGHNGIRSMIDWLETNEFYRLKIGIGRPSDRIDPADYVLGRFSDGEKEKAQDIISTAREGIEMFYSDGPEAAMQMFNR